MSAGRARGALLALVLLVVGVAGAMWSPPAPAAAAPAQIACEPSAVAAGETLAVVVDFGDGRVRTRCTQPGGSGVDVLRRAGFSLVTHGFTTVGGDAAVCAIDDPDAPGRVEEGCATGPDCLLCQQPDSWQYWPAYRYSQIGAGDTRPGAGTVEAWRWGSSQTWPGAKPRVDDVCRVEVPTTTTAPPTTATPTTAPRGDAGGGLDGGGAGGDPSGDGGGGTPGGGAPGSGAPPGSAPGGGDDPSTTAPATSSTTGGTSTTVAGAEPTTGDEAAEVAAAEATRDDDASGPDDDEVAVGAGPAPAAATGPAGDGGAPIGSYAVAGALVAGIGALALRARRRRGSVAGSAAP